MSATLRTVIFFVLWFSLLLVQLLWGESFFQPYLWLATSIVLIVFSFIKPKLNLQGQGWLLVPWIFLISFMGLSMVYSVDIPLSLVKFSEYCLLFLVFLFFYFVQPQFLQKREIALGMIGITLIMSLMSLAVNFMVPDFKQYLPSMNLLFAVYGHSHLSALLLLTLPLAWWLGKQIQPWLGILLLLFFAGMLLLTFGRAAIVIGFVQLLFIVYKSQRLGSLPIKAIQWGMVLIVSAAIVAFLVVSVTLNSTRGCYYGRFTNQICKPLVEEKRPMYWEQAIKGVQERPGLGFGPGTFIRVSTEFRQFPEALVRYAHNSILESFAELGVVGGSLFIVFLVFLLIKSYPPQFFNQQFRFEDALFLGILSSLGTALFDYSWNFSAIFLVVVFYFATLLAFQRTKEGTSKLYTKFTRWFVLMVGGYLVGIGSLYAVTNYWIATGKAQQVFAVFPYFHWQRFTFIELALPEKLTQQRDALYAYDSDYVVKYLPTAEPARTNAIMHLIEIDPWKSLEIDEVEPFLDIENYQAADEILSKKHRFYQEAYAKYGYARESLPDGFKEQTAFQHIRLATYHFLNGEVEKAAEYYRIAYFYEDWSLSRDGIVPPFYNTMDVSKIQQFLEGIESIPPHVFAQNRFRYAEAYGLVMRGKLHQDPPQDITKEIQRGMDFAEWQNDNYLRVIAEVYKQRIEQLLAANQVEAAQQEYLVFLKYYDQMEQYPYQTEEHKVELIEEWRLINGEAMSPAH